MTRHVFQLQCALAEAADIRHLSEDEIRRFLATRLQEALDNLLGVIQQSLDDTGVELQVHDETKVAQRLRRQVTEIVREEGDDDYSVDSSAAVSLTEGEEDGVVTGHVQVWRYMPLEPLEQV